ncbi:hypothetical protein ACSQ67_001064 [Phaseolus vulgaris]
MDYHQSKVENTKIVEKKYDECAAEEFNQEIVSFEERSNYSIEEIEEVYGKIEEERQNINHILEIKELLLNNENGTETEITAWLQMLAFIVVSLEDLMVTDIGTIVSGLQLHWSKKVTREAKRVVQKFKRIIEDHIDENADHSARNKRQDPPTNLDEPLLLNPPMDEGFSLANIPNVDFTTVNIFEDIDDNGNSINHHHQSKEFDETQINPSTENNTEHTGASLTSIQKQKLKLINMLTCPELHTTPHKKLAIINGSQIDSPIIQYSQPAPSTKGQKYVRKQKWKSYHSRPSDTQFSLQRFAAEQRKHTHSNNNNREVVKKDENEVHHQRSNVAPTLHSQGTSDAAEKMAEKLETSKKKLQEGYRAHQRGLCLSFSLYL